MATPMTVSDLAYEDWRYGRPAAVVVTVEFENGDLAGLLPDGRWVTTAWVSDDMANEMAMVREDYVRFVVVEDEGRLTLEDRETGERVQHAARWSREMADWTADRLNKHPQHRVVFDWTKGGAA